MEREEKKIDRLIKATQSASLGNFERRMLPKPTKDYLRALIDPYTTPSGVSCPDKIARKTFRTIVWNKGSFTTGTANRGFLAVYPAGLAYNDCPAVVKSDSDYAGTVVELDGTVTGVQRRESNAPFSTSDITAKNLAARVVACGVRILQTTPELDRGGSVTGMFEPDNGSLGGYNQGSFLAYPDVHAIRPHNKWIHAEVVPVTPGQFDFDDTSPGTATTLPTAPLGMFVVAPGSAPQTFEYEVMAHIEYVGEVVGLEPTNVDPIGQAAILQVAATLGGGASDQWITKISSIVRETAGIVADLTRTVNDARALGAAIAL
jgi:hypothetical protein